MRRAANCRAMTSTWNTTAESGKRYRPGVTGDEHAAHAGRDLRDAWELPGTGDHAVVLRPVGMVPAGFRTGPRVVGLLSDLMGCVVGSQANQGPSRGSGL